MEQLFFLSEIKFNRCISLPDNQMVAQYLNAVIQSTLAEVEASTCNSI